MKRYPVLKQETLRKLARIRKKVSIIRGRASLARLNNNPEARFFSSLPNVKQISTRGPITSDHLIRIKPAPVYIKQKNVEKDIEDFASKYISYFDRHTDGKQTRLDSSPRWGVWSEEGILSFGKNPDETGTISDIVMHTVQAIQQAENMNSLNYRGWKPISEDHIFEAEYWELQQAKLKTEFQNNGLNDYEIIISEDNSPKTLSDLTLDDFIPDKESFGILSLVAIVLILGWFVMRQKNEDEIDAIDMMETYGVEVKLEGGLPGMDQHNPPPQPKYLTLEERKNKESGYVRPIRTRRER